MYYIEQALLMECEGENLVGILALPDMPKDTGVIIIVGGPQYRAGSHRQFVLLSRALAEAGYAVLRFDYRGMGDSTAELRNFENVNADIHAAINRLEDSVPSMRKVVLWGLCDGASASLLYCQATQDQRVRGLCLANPWVRSAASLAKTHVKHYYKQRLREREFWSKLASGRVAWNALAGLGANVKAALSSQPEYTSVTFQVQMAVAWKAFDGDILLLLSGNDFTAKEFSEYSSESEAWAGAFEKQGLYQHVVPDADHTFSDLRFNSVVARHTLNFLSQSRALGH